MPDEDAAQAAFDAQAREWDESSRAPLGRMRCDLALHFLGRHLQGRAAPLTILDAGAGTGSYALPLAQQGHRVCLLDISAQMLAVARENAAALEPALRQRLDFCQASAQQVPTLFDADHFDLILCHTLVEYMSEPQDLFQALTYALKPGGLLSLLAVNPHSDALRWALTKGDLDQARQALGQTRSATTLFGINRHVYTAHALQEMLAGLGIEILATYGVRVFGDYLQADRLADAAYVERLWELERDAGPLAPYAQIARYSLLVGKKPEAT